VKLRWMFPALAVLALSTPVSAEPLRLAQAGPPALLPPHEVVTIVRSTGFDPLGQPVLRGPNYTLRAIDERDREVSLLINGRTGRILSVTPMETASRMPPPRGGLTMGPYERMPPGYVPPEGQGIYGAGPPVADEDDQSVYAPRPPAPVAGPLPRSRTLERPPITESQQPAAVNRSPLSSPRVITSTEPDQEGTPSGVLPPPPERFPQRAVAPPIKPKPPVKRAAAAPKQTPLPKPKPQGNVEAAPPGPPLPPAEAAPPPPAPAEAAPSDPVPN